MSVTSRTGGHRPREPREPGEVSISRPVLGNISFPERNHLKLVSVGVFEKLDVNPSASDRRVVAAVERKSTGNEVNIRPGCQLVSARPAQYQCGRAGSRHIGTRLTGLVCSGIKQEYKRNIPHYYPLQLLSWQPQAPYARHCRLARTWKANTHWLA